MRAFVTLKNMHLSLLGSDLKVKIDDFKDDFNFESLKEALNKKTEP